MLRIVESNTRTPRASWGRQAAEVGPEMGSISSSLAGDISSAICGSVSWPKNVMDLRR